MTNKQMYHGLMLGALLMALVWSGSRHFVAPSYSQTFTSADIIDAYNRGKKDALKTNPVSLDLEYACIDIWAEKQ
jgi:hypothetical protein